MMSECSGGWPQLWDVWSNYLEKIYILLYIIMHYVLFIMCTFYGQVLQFSVVTAFTVLQLCIP